VSARLRPGQRLVVNAAPVEPRAGGSHPAISVPAAFDAAAPHYDLMVGLNPGYHHNLRTAAAALVDSLSEPAGGTPGPVLDLGCGSGASTRALSAAFAARSRANPQIVGVDGSAGMLAVARGKSWPANVRFHHALAEDVAAEWEGLELPAHAQGAFAAYLFRNLADSDVVLAALRRLLRPGGALVVQEYSVAGSRSAALVWSLVCWLVVIPLSWLSSRDTALYRYLWRSVLRFDSVAEFADRLTRAGFVDVQVRTAPGWQRGILHTFRARTPW